MGTDKLIENQYYIVKLVVEETYKVKAINKGHAEFLAGGSLNSVIISRDITSKKAEVVEDPFNHDSEKGENIPTTYGELFTMKKFKDYVNGGLINDYDGIGKFSDGKKEFHEISTVTQLDETYSHVMWYNK